MLPAIATKATLEKIYSDYLIALARTKFQGDIFCDYASRIAVATDNSIFQVIPQAVVCPKNTNDIATLFKLAAKTQFQTIKFSPRGGGTGTNGQSLSSGIIIDCAKHMRHILEINPDEMWVRVQPGVILDELNQFLKPYQLYFPVEISPSNRATLGGMINTDACGVGSKKIGRTSDHVLDLTCALSDGNIIHSKSNTPLHTAVADKITQAKSLITNQFPDAPRSLTGYNLKKLNDTTCDLNYLFCGSEGTLAVIAECKLKLSSIPRHKKLAVIQFTNFNDALRANALWHQLNPLVIETIDEKLIALARKDQLFHGIKHIIVDSACAINLVEFVADNEIELEQTLEILQKNILSVPTVVGCYVAKTTDEEKLLWDLRKKSVGLISKTEHNNRRPIPFIEDTAVAPEKLADYITDFKKILDAHGLIYGMYGHIDAGCVHVRPALNLQSQYDETLLRTLSDEIVALIKRYGGVLWGEHGMGHRTEYAPDFFGEKLYQVIRTIKTIFDPNNRLNPGKIAAPLSCQEPLVKMDAPLRAHFDKTIPQHSQHEFASALNCNGNGACFNYATADVMCPSFKVTQNRIHSPKGRAVLIREWLRQLSQKKVNLAEIRSAHFFKKIIYAFTRKKDFSTEVYDALHGCLGCKACEFQCPLNVNIPDFKAKFIAYYHQRYLRPLRDYLFASIEITAPIMAKFPRIYHIVFNNFLMRWIYKTFFKLVDPPNFPASKQITLNKNTIETAEVILLQDVFTTFYEPTILQAVIHFLNKLNIPFYLAPYFPNGKPWHANGFSKKFATIARKNNIFLRELAQKNIPIIGIEPSITLTYRDEYAKVNSDFSVLLLQEWLHTQLDRIKTILPPSKTKTFYLLSHCTEKSALTNSDELWKKFFSACGLNLVILSAGCCGMAGNYGHEAEHFANSQQLFKSSWEKFTQDKTMQPHLLATGFSCREQIKRFAHLHIKHPIEIFFS